MSSILPRLLEVALRRGDAPAIRSGATLTYRELYGRAASLARRLRSSGHGRDSVIALELPQAAEHVIAVLGVWLAGAAFAPIDVRYPPERRRRVLELLQPRLILAAADLEVCSAEPVAEPSVEADDLAYVICSSGTTGAPKAVAVTHRGLPAVIEAQVACFAIEPSSRVLWSLSPAFDASLSDILTTLLAGATLVIAPPAQLVPGVTLEATLAARAISHWDVPPAVLRRMDATLLPASIRTLVIGGEVTPPDVVRAFARRCRVVNVYGPTEASICTSMVRCDPETWARPLIGERVPGVRYRLDGDELLIAGPALARGYLGDDELTRQRFVTQDGARWYRTRDRVRAGPDGALEFVGRIDRQLKLNGVLIEPEEIEACLGRFPGVVRAAVLPRSVCEERAPVLVAYIAPPVDEPSLRAHLEQALPPTHQPARIELLAELPATASGKVDYDALAKLPCAFEAGAGEEGGALARIWAEVLRLPSVGLDDDVRALGAGSLDVLSVTAKAHAAGLVLSPEVLASRRTLRAMLESPVAVALSAESLERDAADLARTLAGCSPPPAIGGGRVLLTGATGFVGSWLLGALLDAGREVVCLVRDEARLAARPGLAVVRGDLEEELLGLSAGRWHELAGSVSDVVHCGARVNMLAAYTDLRGPNVVGTRRVLELCGRGRAKRFTHVSTLSVFADADHDPSATRFDESFALERTQRVHGGYAQSKWAAERLVAMAAHDLEDVACVRLGLVIGDSRHGTVPRHDLLASVVRGMSQLGSLPERLSMSLATGAMPVDYAGRALAALVRAQRPAAALTTYHLASDAGMTVGMLRSALAEHGHHLDDVDSDAWLAAQRASGAPSIAVAAFCHALDPVRFAAYRALDPFAASHLSFVADATREVLAAAGLPPCPRPTPALASTFVRGVVSAT